MNSFNRGASPRPTPGFPARSGIVSCGRGGFLPPRDPVETGRGRGFASRGRTVKTVLVFPWFGALCFKGFRARASPFSPSIHVTSSNFIRDSIDRRPSFEYVFYLVEISGTVRIRPADVR